MKRQRTTMITTPAKKGKAKPYTRKGYKRFGAVPRPLVQYSSGFPKQMNITHRYTQVVNLVFTGPTLNAQYTSFYTNGLWDPFVALGGHQPLYFDQLTAIYNHYTVMKSRIKATVNAYDNYGYVCGILVDDDGAPAYTFLETMMEQPSAVTKTSHQEVDTKSLYKSWDCKSVFGPNPTDNDRLEGDSASNPLETQAFVFFVRPQESATAITSYQVTFELEYDTVWHELKLMALS